MATGEGIKKAAEGTKNVTDRVVDAVEGKVHDVTDAVGDKVGDVTDAVGEKAGDVTGAVKDASDWAGDKVHKAAGGDGTVEKK